MLLEAATFEDLRGKWQAAIRLAEKNGRNVQQEIRAALKEHVARGS